MKSLGLSPCHGTVSILNANRHGFNSCAESLRPHRLAPHSFHTTQGQWEWVFIHLFISDSLSPPAAHWGESKNWKSNESFTCSTTLVGLSCWCMRACSISRKATEQLLWSMSFARHFLSSVLDTSSITNCGNCDLSVGLTPQLFIGRLNFSVFPQEFSWVSQVLVVAGTVICSVPLKCALQPCLIQKHNRCEFQGSARGRRTLSQEHLVKHTALGGGALALHHMGVSWYVCPELVSFWVGMHIVSVTMLFPKWFHNGRRSPHSHQYSAVSLVTCSQWYLNATFAHHAVLIVTSLWGPNSWFSVCLIWGFGILPCSSTFSHLSGGLSVFEYWFVKFCWLVS